MRASNATTLKDQGIEETHIRLIDKMYSERGGWIILHKENEKFTITKVPRQEGTISPDFVTECLEEIVIRLNKENAGLRIIWE